MRLTHDVEPLLGLRLLRRDDRAHAVDEDYVVAAERRERGASTSARRRIGVAGAVALAVFAVLATAMIVLNYLVRVARAR